MNDKTFIISNPNKLRVGRISIKENTTKRRMEFTTNNFAYTCDIEALHYKIDTLYEQIEKNDIALATTLNEFPTVDEVNTAIDELKKNMANMDNLYTKEEADNKYSTKSIVYDLQQYLEDNYMSWDQVQAGYYDKNDCDSKFALKTQIIELQNKIATLESELSKYRKVDDITYTRDTPLSITNKINQFGDDTNIYTSHRVMTSHVSYHKHTRMVGVIHEIGDINIQFDVVFISYYSDSIECPVGTKHLTYIMEFDIDYTPSNVILNDAQYELSWDSVTCSVFTCCIE